MRLPIDPAAPRATLTWVVAALISAPLCAHAGQGGSRSDNSSQGSGNGAASKNDSEMTTIVFGIVTVVAALGALEPGSPLV